MLRKGNPALENPVNRKERAERNRGLLIHGRQDVDLPSIAIYENRDRVVARLRSNPAPLSIQEFECGSYSRPASSQPAQTALVRTDRPAFCRGAPLLAFSAGGQRRKLLPTRKRSMKRRPHN